MEYFQRNFMNIKGVTKGKMSSFRGLQLFCAFVNKLAERAMVSFQDFCNLLLDSLIYKYPRAGGQRLV